MGIRGLTKVVREYGTTEPLHMREKEGKGRILLVDGGSLKYHVLSQLKTPALTLSGGLDHAETHDLFVKWIEFYSVYLGLHVHVVCDGGTVGSLQGGSAATFMKRRKDATAKCSWWAARWPNLPLRELSDEKRCEAVLGAFSQGTLEHAIMTAHNNGGGSVSIDIAMEDADTAVRAYYQEHSADVFAVATNDSDFFVWCRPNFYTHYLNMMFY